MKPMNVIGVLKESEKEEKKCVLCGKRYSGWGNDAWPLADGYCCDKCNNEKVIPARIAQMYGTKNESNLNESKGKYSYITGANEYDEVYNSEANTDVHLILNELKRYFDESYVCAEGIIKNANHDPGVYDSDLELLKFSCEKVQELIDKWDSAWK